jgi:stage II sporulation protein M
VKKVLLDHLRHYWVIYLTLCCVLFAGVVFGAIGVKALGQTKSQELADFFNNLLLQQPKTIEAGFIKQLARDYFIMMAGIWVLGLTVIGTPLVYLIVFTRGFILGFTIAFIINLKKMLGLGLVVFTIILPSVLAIPCLLLAAGLATIFSFLLLQGRNTGNILRQDFLYYCAASFLICLGAVVAGVLQGYFSIAGLHIFNL